MTQEAPHRPAGASGLMQLVFAADERLAMPLAVTLYSVLESVAPGAFAG
jgi:hypothetical protein